MTTWKVTATGPTGKLKARYNEDYIFDAFRRACREFAARVYGGRKHRQKGFYGINENGFKFPPKDAESFSCSIYICKQYTRADPIFLQ